MSYRPLPSVVLATVLACAATLARAAEPAEAPSPATPAATAATTDTPGDNRKLPAWFKELTEVVLTNSPAAKAAAEAKLTAARLAKDTQTEAYALLMLSHVARRQNDTVGALRLSREALTLAERAHEGDAVLNYNTNYGHALNLRAVGDYASSIDFLLRSLRIADSHLSVVAQNNTVAALGSSYEHLGDMKRALDYTQRSLALAEKLGDEKAVGMYANNLGSLEEKLGDLAAARRDYNRAMVIARKEGNRTNIADLEEQIAMLDFAEGQAEAALTILDRVLAQRRTLRSGKLKLTNTLGCRSEVLLKLGRLDEALAAIEEARGYADAIESRNLRAVLYRRLAAVQEARGDFAAALASARREFTEREAIAGEAAKNRAAELQIQFDVAKKDEELSRLARQNELQAAEARTHAAQLALNASELRAKDAELRAQRAELDRARTIRYALVGGLGAGILALGGFAALQRSRLRAKQRALEQTRAARDAAEEADRVKTRFLGIASHDIRGPLGNIVNLTQTLRTEPADTGEVAGRLDLITSEAQRVIGLVQDLIATAALEAGKLELRLSPIDLTEVTRAVLTALRWQAAAKRQTLTFAEPPPGTGQIHGDPDRLNQVVANLVANAIKFSPFDQTISLSLTRTATTVILSVRDRGPGIDPREFARLFAPFERLSSHPTGGESSHGLGLSIAQEIARLHRGRVTVESAPGEGATFSVELPISPASP